MTSDSARKIGERIRQAREAKDLAQEALARAVGLAGQTIYRYEVGRIRLGGEALTHIAQALGVSERWLMTGETADPPPRVVRETVPRSFFEWWDTLRPRDCDAATAERMVVTASQSGWPTSAAAWGEVYLRVRHDHGIETGMRPTPRGRAKRKRA